MITHQVPVARRPREAVLTTTALRRLLLRGALSCVSCALLALSGSAFAQGFPGGGGGSHGSHGGHPPHDAARQPAAPQTVTPREPLEALLRTALELRESMMLDAAQTERWAEMQADLRDALDKRRALVQKPADPVQVPNPALLFIQDMASAESALGSTLDKLSRSMQAAFEALNERQKKIFVEKMTVALSPGG